MSALLVQRRVRSDSGSPAWEAAAPAIRIPLVTGVATAQEIPGGYTTADFTIPARYARLDPEDVRYNTQVWLFDGYEPIFFGYVTRSVPMRDGGIAVSLVGAYDLLSRTRMRIIWADDQLDTSKPAPGSRKSGEVSTNSVGTPVISLPKDHSYTAGDYVALDYFLFNESIGLRDTRIIDGFDITIGSQSDFDQNANLEVRIQGLSDPSDDTPVLLQRFTTSGVSRQESADASHGDNTSAWPNGNGYRCIRVGLFVTGAITSLANDRELHLPTFRVSTRARQLGMIADRQTTTLLRDMFHAAHQTYDVHHLLQEEGNQLDNDLVVGNIADSDYFVSNVAFTEWSTPQEIIEHFASIDGSKVGMWFPTQNPSVNSHVVQSGTSLNYWSRLPAELKYEDWSDLSDPDYTIRLQRGAEWEPDSQADELITATYVNYTSRRGREASVFVEDTDQDNYLYEQGWHEATDWQIDPPVSQRTASTLGDRYTRTRRQPVLSGTLTIKGDRPGAIEARNGARVLKLGAFRAGSVIRIADAKGAQAGRVTRCEFTARNGSEPDTLVLSVNSPAAERLDRRLARMASRADRQRTR